MTMYLKCGVCNACRIEDIRSCQRQMCPIQASTKATGRITGSGVELASVELPIPMRLHCPSCHELHVDRYTFSTKPHHTHACQNCGAVWRPAIGPTVGVQFLPGFKDDADEQFVVNLDNNIGGHAPTCPAAQMFLAPKAVPGKVYRCDCGALSRSS